MAPVRKNLVNFLKDSSGGATIEGVLWLPIYAVFMVLIVDTSLMFNGKAQAQRTLQDINRLASSGYYLSEEEVEARALTLLSHLSSNVTVDFMVGLLALRSVPTSC